MSAIHRTAAALLTITSLTAVPAAAQGTTEIVVNIPAGRLDVFQGGERVRSYPVSVGTSAHATPTGEASIRRVVINPGWTPPDATWARDEKPKGPGWSNPMGRAKIHLFRDYYVHGTPAGNERHLGRPASHGCIRMRNHDVMELAALVLRADGTSASDATVQALLRNPSATRELSLSGRVHVRIEYRLAEVDSNSVTLHPDVYGVAGRGYTARVRQELAAAGADATPVLERLALSGTVSAPLRVARGAMPVPQPELALAGAPASALVIALQR